MSHIYRNLFGVFLFSILLTLESNAAVSSGFPSSINSVSKIQDNTRQFKALKRMARLENILEGEKKSKWWFWTLSVIGVFIGFHFLFPELGAIELILGTIGFFALFFLFVVGFGLLLQWLYDRAKRRRLG